LNSRSTGVTPPNGWRAFSVKKLAIKGGRIIDPNSGVDKKTDLIIQNGKIKGVGRLPDGWEGELIDAAGWVVCPGLFDMHVHLREPGYEYKETIQTGCIAAAVGGFTGVAPMPNTDPPIDNPGLVRFLRAQATGLPVEVHPIPAVTRGREGKILAELAELHDAGATAFSDDGSPVVSSGLMRRALEYTRMLNAVIIEHCEEPTLTNGGVMHEGRVSAALGLPGWPSIGEEIAVERNLRLVEFTGGRLHIAHVSTAGSVDLIRQAKARGLNVTAEATPHHLTLDCTALESYNPDFKVNPPLRTAEDVEALIEGLTDGTIDAIATDHAPHARDEKEVEFTEAPFGMIGLETALGVLLTRLVAEGRVSLTRMIEALTVAPRRILNLPQAAIEPGRPANLTMFDPDESWTVDRYRLHSRSQNTPYHGWELTGRARGVMGCGLAWLRQD